ncbi:MAG: hypothetical protein JO316_05835 [Abitibacteriaceae bacterium]|nr:hypothetical protein [Abditibacteriaceae bacterium]
MEPDRLTVNLFDFLYRDSSRISSYSAQMFGGLLASSSRGGTTSHTEDRSTKLGAAVASHEQKTSDQAQESESRVFDPHDAAIMDVFNVIVGSNSVHFDLLNAPHGSIVIALGTLVFVDRSMIEMSTIAIESKIRQERDKPRHSQDKAAIANFEMMEKFLQKAPIPSSFLLNTPFGLHVVGTIKDEGMEEPISTYYFKHGTGGLADVVLIGIKEVPSPIFDISEESLLGVSHVVADLLSSMIFPPDAMRVTPIAIYRQLNKNGLPDITEVEDQAVQEEATPHPS